jgi:hypothetical protein
MAKTKEEFETYLDLVYNEIEIVYEKFCYKTGDKRQKELENLLRPLINRLRTIEKRQIRLLERLEKLEDANH